MTRPISVLFVADDESDLASEWQLASGGVTDVKVRANVAEGVAAATRMAQAEPPDVACIAVPLRSVDLALLIDELRACAPRCVMVGLIDGSKFESGDAEARFIVEATRAGLRDFLRRPLSSSELQPCLRRATDTHGANTSEPNAAGRITAFVSNKGGVGKTTLSVNVACELARREPGSVLLVDAALQLGLCASMLDLEARVTMHDIVRQMDRLDRTLLREMVIEHPSGLELLAAPGNAVQAAAVEEQHLSRILAVARTAYRHVIVDTFPILDGIAITTLDRADDTWLVFAPTVPTVLGAERMIELLEGVGVETSRLHLALNTSIPTRAAQLAPRDVATRLQREIDLVVPFSRSAAAACNSGQPAVLSTARWSRFRRCIMDLADMVAANRDPAGAAP